jgi:hypothetical protein
VSEIFRISAIFCCSLVLLGIANFNFSNSEPFKLFILVHANNTCKYSLYFGELNKYSEKLFAILKIAQNAPTVIGKS